MSCNSGSKKIPGQSNKDRLNDVWAAVRIQGNPINRMVDVPRLEINISEMKIYGNDGCNNYFGSISELTENNITLKGLGGTKKMCANMEVPDRFNKALSKISSYRLDKQFLIFDDDDGNEILAFTKTD